MKIKRILALTLALIMLFSVASCNKKEKDDPGASGPVRVYTLNGTTGFGMAKLMNDYAGKEDYSFAVQTDPEVVTKALIAGDIDIAALPTNAAANLYKRTNGAIQILAINTLGCFHLISNAANPITDFSQLEGQTVYAPAQNPYFVLKYLCQQKGINVNIDSTTFAKPDALKDAVASGTVALAVLPEPMVTIAKAAAKNQGNTLTTLDLAPVWESVSNQELVIGCVVARKEFIEARPDAVAKFLTEYKASIEYLNANAADAAQMIAAQGIFANATVAQNAIPRCNVVYLDGTAMKNAMHNYMGILATIDTMYALPGDDFYYIP